MRPTSSVLCVALTCLLIPVPALAGLPDSSVLLSISRIEEPEHAGFGLSMNLTISVPGVTSVVVSVGSEDFDAVFFEDNGEWEVEQEYADLQAAKGALHGAWTVTVEGSTPSVSSFVLDAQSLQESDFYPVPTLSPGQGETAAPDVLLSWTDPTGAETPYVLVVEVGSNSGGSQEAFSLDDPAPITVTDTSWQPPELLGVGENEFSVFYMEADSSRVTDLQVDSGAIIWGNSEFAPPSYPTPRPLLGLSVEKELLFQVEVVEDFESYSTQLDDTGQPDNGGRAYFVTRTGNEVVASASESLADSTGILDEGGNQVWGVGSAAGTTGSLAGTEGFLVLANLPGAAPTRVGPFADYLSPPRGFWETSVEARVRQSGGAGATQFRFVLFDQSTNRIATQMSALSAGFASYAADPEDFDTLVGSCCFDFDHVAGVGLEFFVDPLPFAPESAPFAAFAIDDVRLAPEPAGAAPFALVLVLLAARSSSRRRPQSRP